MTGRKTTTEGPRRLSLADAANLPMLLSVAELGAVTGWPRNTCYAAVQRGDVESIDRGGRKYVLTAPLLRRFGVYSPSPTAPVDIHGQSRPQKIV